MIITGVDPGGTTGVARFVDGHPVDMTQVSLNEFDDWLDAQLPELWVVEDYFILPPHMNKGWAHQWDKGETLRLIGKIQYHAHLHNIPLVLQQPSIKALAAKLLGQTYKSNSRDPYRHAKDAVLHVQWYLHKQGPNAS